MTRFFCAAAALLAFGLAARAAPAGDPRPAPREISLPRDGKTAVVTLDYKGGFTPPRKSADPYLVIRADGTVILTNPFTDEKPRETRLTAAELQDLLRFAIVDNDFFGFDQTKVAAAVKAEQAKKGPGLFVADAATTFIRIQADGKEQEARYYALGMAARQYPDVKPLGQLYAIEERLQKLMKDLREKK